ncbi:g4816 [Coccomyxa viridis]|uniref:G4816 protein n=1 Tax=Coccomyxa viridis TaxID=1274662 RepID=A0ABP1FR98_9CHLO
MRVVPFQLRRGLCGNKCWESCLCQFNRGRTRRLDESDAPVDAAPQQPRPGAQDQQRSAQQDNAHPTFVAPLSGVINGTADVAASSSAPSASSITLSGNWSGHSLARDMEQNSINAQHPQAPNEISDSRMLLALCPASSSVARLPSWIPPILSELSGSPFASSMRANLTRTPSIQGDEYISLLQSCVDPLLDCASWPWEVPDDEQLLSELLTPGSQDVVSTQAAQQQAAEEQPAASGLPVSAHTLWCVARVEVRKLLRALSRLRPRYDTASVLGSTELTPG